MATDREQWVEETLNSLQGMERATPPPFLFTRIAAKIDALDTGYVPRHWLRWALACMALWLALNTFVLLRASGDNTGAGDSYQLESVNFELY